VNLRTRVALAGGAVVVAALTAVGAVLYPAIEAGMRGQTDSSLRMAAGQAPTTYEAVKAKLDAIAEQGVPGKPGGVGQTKAGQPAGSQGQTFELASYGLQFVQQPVVGSTTNFTPLTKRDVEVEAGTTEPYFEDQSYGGVDYRVYTTPLAGYPGVLLRVTRLASDPKPTLTRLAWLMALLTPAAGLLAVFAARILARRVLGPVGRLTAAVEHITATGDLSTPVDVRSRDEVGRLGRAFTAMTAALDGSVGAQRRLVADASHELRTPLTSLTTNLELLAENLADPQAPALVDDALVEARELKTLINDLVDLAKFGEAVGPAADVRLDLVAVRIGQGRRVAVASEPVVIHGDPAALERAVANLVDNAVKFGGGNEAGRAAVRVTVGVSGDRAVVDVLDHGPGIPAADLPYIFDRFHRSPAARALPGSGLGLAIVKQIVDAHGGTVAAVPQPVGVLFRLTLPIRR
jgi:signal transduction histidine kinase